MSETKHPEPKFELGELVILKSYASQKKGKERVQDQATAIFHHSPFMVVTGIEIEDEKKKTHDNELGKQIGECIKYHLMWFDNKKSDFVAKVLYESFLSKKSDRKSDQIKYQFGKGCQFATAELEKQRKITTSYKSAEEDESDAKNSSKQRRMTSFICPPLLCTGIRKNDKSSIYHDQGGIKAKWSDTLIKVLWFNHHQQKYSEKELPKECLID